MPKQKCLFKPAVLPNFPEIEYKGYQLTPTWVAVNDKATKNPWVLYHAQNGSYVTFARTIRQAEFLALALGEVGPWSGLQVKRAIEWARVQAELEDAQKALERAKKKAQGPVIEKLTEAT